MRSTFFAAILLGSIATAGFGADITTIPGGNGTPDTTNAQPLPLPAASDNETPDNERTPGVVAEDGQDEATVCGRVDGLTYSKRHRQTPSALKAFIRKRDGCEPPPYSEVDHRCPLAIGCADVVYNLWCQPGRNVTWTYHDKDRLETWAYQQVCIHHALALDKAQAIFLAPSDWRIEYCKVFTDDDRCRN